MDGNFFYKPHNWHTVKTIKAVMSARISKPTHFFKLICLEYFIFII